MQVRLCLLVPLLFLIVSFVPAQTPDGETPTQEAICDGEAGAAFGLCTAYCEAMDCDSDDPSASETACQKIATKFYNLTGRDLPCEVPEILCPCFELADFAALGQGPPTGGICGPYPPYDRSVIQWFFGPYYSYACSGVGCPNPPYNGCSARLWETNIVTVNSLSPEEDAACRAIILEACDLLSGP